MGAEVEETDDQDELSEVTVCTGAGEFEEFGGEIGRVTGGLFPMTTRRTLPRQTTLGEEETDGVCDAGGMVSRSTLVGYVRIFELGSVLATRCENETLNKQSRDIAGGEHVGKVDPDVGTGEHATQLLNTGDGTEEPYLLRCSAQSARLLCGASCWWRHARTWNRIEGR